MCSKVLRITFLIPLPTGHQQWACLLILQEATKNNLQALIRVSKQCICCAASACWAMPCPFQSLLVVCLKKGISLTWRCLEARQGKHRRMNVVMECTGWHQDAKGQGVGETAQPQSRIWPQCAGDWPQWIWQIIHHKVFPCPHKAARNISNLHNKSPSIWIYWQWQCSSNMYALNSKRAEVLL